MRRSGRVRGKRGEIKLVFFIIVLSVLAAAALQFILERGCSSRRPEETIREVPSEGPSLERLRKTYGDMLDPADAEFLKKALDEKGAPPDLEALKKAYTGKMDPEELDRILKAYQELQAGNP